MDLGTGDGRAVLRLARGQPGSLVIGVDTNAAGLIEASAPKRASPNALFLVGDARDALQLLRGRVDELRITLPWGSLLRLVLDGEVEFANAVAGSL